MIKRYPDSICVVGLGDFPGRRNDRREYKVSIKNFSNQKVCAGHDRNKLFLYIKARSAAFFKRFVNSLLKSFHLCGWTTDYAPNFTNFIIWVNCRYYFIQNLMDTLNKYVYLW